MKSGMKSGRSEIIEIIDDDADWTTGRSPTPHPMPDTGRRWIGPVAISNASRGDRVRGGQLGDLIRLRER